MPEKMFESESATKLTIFVTWRKTVTKSPRIASEGWPTPSAATMTTAPFGMLFALLPDSELG